MSERSITIPATSDNSFTPKLTYIHNSKVVKFEENRLKQDKIPFTHGNVVNYFILYKLAIYSRDLHSNFTLKYCLFRVVMVTKNVDPNKYSYFGHAIGFDSQPSLLISNFEFGKTVINNILILIMIIEELIRGLDNSTIKAEAKYSINFPA